MVGEGDLVEGKLGGIQSQWSDFDGHLLRLLGNKWSSIKEPQPWACMWLVFGVCFAECNFLSRISSAANQKHTYIHTYNITLQLSETNTSQSILLPCFSSVKNSSQASLFWWANYDLLVGCNLSGISYLNDFVYLQASKQASHERTPNQRKSV